MADSKPEVGGRTERLCKPCSLKGTTRAADVFCSTCQQFQCTDCKNYHKVFPGMENHDLVPVCESQVGQSTDDSDLVGKKNDRLDDSGVVGVKDIYICKKHNKPFEFYCEDDKVLACSSCVILGHKKCDAVVDITEKSNDGQFNELREVLQKAIMKSNHAVENVTKADGCISVDVQNLPERLKNMEKKMNECFEDFAEKVTKEANTYRSTITSNWAQKKAECENKIKTMKSILNTMDNIASKGTTSQQFIAEHSMRQSVQNHVMNADSLYTDLKMLNISCSFNEQFDTFRTNLLSTMKTNELEMKYSVPKKTRLEQIGSIDLKQTGDDVGEPFYSGLDFLPDGRLVVVDNENGKCLLYDGLNLKTTYKLPYKHPQCVVVVSEDEVAITTGGEYRLDFLTVSKSNEITLKRTCKVKVQYYSISMKDDENFVVSTLDHNPPVRIISKSGEEKDFDIRFPTKKYSVGTSSCTYIRGQDKIVFTDTDKDTVYIYDTETDEKIAIKDELIKSPCDVAVGPGDHVFVVSNGTKSLVEITPCGRVLSSFQLDMNYPRNLAVSKDRKTLAVSNSSVSCRKLSLYKLISE